MKISKTLLTGLIAVFFVAFNQTGHTQHFEGEIRVAFHDLTDDSTEEFTMFIAENRMTVAGSLKNYADFPLLRDALTIRADKNDLLIHSETNVAVVNLRDLELLIKQMFPAEQRQQVETDEVEDRLRITETGETRTIHGHTARKTIAKDKENENRETHIWLSDLQIDWENIFSPIFSLLDTIGGDINLNELDWPLDRTPLLLEFYEDGELKMRGEITELKERSLEPGEVDVPADKQAISLFQLMMQQN